LTNRPSVAEASTERTLAAATRLRAKLAGKSLGQAGISDYNQRYLADHLSKRDGATLRMYARLLTQTLDGLERKLGDAVLVDFGGGSGLMSLLAKELGVGTVIYVDVYDISCADVVKLGDAVDLPPDIVICGDLEDLIRQVHARGLRVDAMVSSDVIEHIYDVPGHLQRLPALVTASFRAVYASTANIKNPRYVRWISRVQRDLELKPRTSGWGHKERDSLQAYRAIRADLIRGYGPTLSDAAVEELASATRGLRKEDIQRSVKEFETTGRIAYRIEHPTNTCDPLTGNWAEHLMAHDWLQQMSETAGFAVAIAPGPYELNGSIAKRFAQALANISIGAAGKRGLILAPYFTLRLDR
jgi:hypothetical protein